MDRNLALGGIVVAFAALVSCGAPPEPRSGQARQGLIINEGDPEPEGKIDADSPIETDHTIRLLCGRDRRSYTDITGSGYGANESAARRACEGKLRQRATDRTRCDNDRCEEIDFSPMWDRPDCKPNTRIYDVTYECRERSRGEGDQRWRCTCEADWALYRCTRCGDE